MTRRGGDARELAAMLAARIGVLAPELLPAGQRDGRHWRCGSLAGEPGQSLAINLTGGKAGVWHDFSTGEAGDALDLVAGVLFRGDRRAAMAWAAGWLGLARHGAPGRAVPPTRQPLPAIATSMESAEDVTRRRRALALFLDAAPVAATPAAAYLAARGLPVEDLRHPPRALRFHPACFCTEIRAPLPAMLAAIVTAEGQHLGTHRTWLARGEDGFWRKAPLCDPKKTYGGYRGGFVPLARGASGQPIRRAPRGEAVAIAEGIETALSVALACPELRVLASVALPNMARIVLPPAIGRVILCADADHDNQAASALLDAAARHFAAEGRDVRIARPPVGKDFNDTLNQSP
jgi:hypothetical protein